MTKLFGDSANALADKLDATAAAEGSGPAGAAEVNIEDELYAMALDVIGKAVFNYDFGALDDDTPLIKAVYRVLR